MKKKILAAMILGLISVAAIHAQDGYETGKVFDGIYFSKTEAYEVNVKGSDLSAYKLNMYHSISTVCDLETVMQVSGAVLRDAEFATDIETEYSGEIPTYILLRTLRLSPKNKNTYICFKAVPVEDGKYKIIVVWMTGDATLEELKSTFVK